METALIKYEDWLIKVRGKVEPKVGDKVKSPFNDELEDIVLDYRENDGTWVTTCNEIIHISDCFVKIDLPKIEWQDISNNNGSKFNGYFSNLLLFRITLFPNGDGTQYYIVESLVKFKPVESHPLKNYWQYTSNNIKDCKLQTSKLLYKL